VADNSELRPALRAQRYRELAAQARRAACAARGDVKQSYFMLAEQWDALAARLEADIRSDEYRAEGNDLGLSR
jgi:hypothetical protein